MKTNIYVDGFNLYYGCLKNTPYKWLNLAQLCQKLLPQNSILNEIKYFTALINSSPIDPQKPFRQQIYLRALQTIPNLTIYEGRFLTHTVRMPLANPTPTQKTVEVIKTEEKGSDVNLASQLLIDGMRGKYDMAVIISNDSDLLMPIEFITGDLKLPVGILNPQKNPSRVLLQKVTWIKPIRSGVLASSQFPPTLTDQHGTFYKPKSW
jgi:hypothetical protein